MIGLVDGNNFYVSCERVFDRKLVGRPVAVLSNNDGCCVAMSPEFKALGIARGTPYFMLKDREAPAGTYDGLIFRSSNYELYGDISRRILMILREEACGVEQYSIDEAFIVPPAEPAARAAGDERTVSNDGEGWLYAYGAALRAKLLRWVGIPCGVGFAKTKTLAKIANHIGKKRPSGVFVMPEDPTGILAKLPVDEVWGVGRRLPLRLRAERIVTARDLRDAREAVLRAVGGVTLVRTAMELRGIPCVTERAYDADPESVSCSRSFGVPVTTREALAESVASFAAQAAVKLRRHGMLASGCTVYAQLSDQSFVERTVVFPEATDATNDMLAAMRADVDALFVPGGRYRKSGIVFFGLEKVGSACQLDFFEEAKIPTGSKLYEAVDRMNRRYGGGSVRAASEGLQGRKPSWTMRRDKLSRVSTTNWKRLPSVR